MISTLDTIDLTDGFQPAIDLRERATADENGWIALIALAALFSVGAWICKYKLHGYIAWFWGIPFCAYR